MSPDQQVERPRGLKGGLVRVVGGSNTALPEETSSGERDAQRGCQEADLLLQVQSFSLNTSQLLLLKS